MVIKVLPMFLFFAVILGFIFILQIKNKFNYICVDVILKLIGIILVFGELSKFVMEKGSYSQLPFFLSSIQIFLICFVAFYKNKQDDIYKTLYLLTLVLSFVTTFLIIFYPYVIVGSTKEPYHDFFTFWVPFSHVLVFFSFGLLTMFRKISFSLTNWIYSIVITFITAVFIEVISITINTSYDGSLGDIIGLKHVTWWFVGIWVLGITLISAIVSYFVRLIPSFFIREKPKWRF